MIAEPEGTQAQNERKSQGRDKVPDLGQIIQARLTENGQLPSMRSLPEMLRVLGRSIEKLEFLAHEANKERGVPL
jgi:hypothetical protein